MTSAIYQDFPLTNDTPETRHRIRVIVLRAGSGDSPIVCGLDYDDCDKQKPQQPEELIGFSDDDGQNGKYCRIGEDGYAALHDDDWRDKSNGRGDEDTVQHIMFGRDEYLAQNPEERLDFEFLQVDTLNWQAYGTRENGYYTPMRSICADESYGQCEIGPWYIMPGSDDHFAQQPQERSGFGFPQMDDARNPQDKNTGKWHEFSDKDGQNDKDCRTNEEGGYSALSYVWGEESDGKNEITVRYVTEAKDTKKINEEEVTITIWRNLYEALKQIRDPKHDQRLWVDALCIDQGDDREKSQQVGMMGKIFENANSVIRWLGPESDNSDRAMDLLSDPTKLEAYFRANNPSEAVEDKEALLNLCNRSYWKRVWIIQEIFLAQDFVVRCGTKAIPGHLFEQSLTEFHGRAAQVHDWEKSLERTTADMHRVKQGGKGVYTLNKLFRWLRFCVSGGFQATKKQDFVYALLSISQDWKDGKVKIMPDYSKDVKEVFLDVLSAELRDMNLKSALEIAAMMGLGSNPSVLRMKASGGTLAELHKMLANEIWSANEAAFSELPFHYADIVANENAFAELPYHDAELDTPSLAESSEEEEAEEGEEW